MVTDVHQAYCGWSQENNLSDQDENRDVFVSQMLDHGSISFGRYASESLEWERRSVFTHDKYQEELEKLKCPGLVAQKKAYFEEHYKKIRALKTLQENHQTELTLEYGADGSISKQTGEEDESALQLENLGDGAPNAIDTCSKEASIEVTVQKKGDAEAIQMKHLDREPTLSNLISFHGRRDSYARQMQWLDTGSTVNEPLVRTEKDKQHDLSDFDGKENSSAYDKLEFIAVKEENSSYDVQNYDERESIVHKLLVRTEEIGLHEVCSLNAEGISRKHNSLEPTPEIEDSDGGTVLCPRISNSEKLELKADCNIVSEKTNPIKRHKDYIPVPKVKGSAASVSKVVKVDLKSQSEIKSSQGPKHPFQKGNNKGKNSFGSDNTSVDRVSVNRKSTTFASSSPLTELHSNATTLPLPFCTERRSSAPASSRDTASRFSTKTPNRLTSLLNQSKDATNAQGSAASVSKVVKVDLKSQSEMKLSQGPKHPFQKGNSKGKNSFGSDNTSVDRVSGNCKSTTFTFASPLTELHSNATTLPLSFATERRSAAPASSRDTASRFGTKTPNRLTSLLNQSKDTTNAQDISKKASMAQGVKSIELENKRSCAEVRKRALTLEKQYTNINGRYEIIPGPSNNRMPRSLNHPSCIQSNQNVPSEYRSTNSGRMRALEDGKEDAGTRKNIISGTKVVSPSAGNLKLESRKVKSSQTNHLTLQGRKPQIGGLSLTETKPRKVNPPWR